MKKLYLLMTVVAFATACKTGEIDEIPMSNPEISFEVTEHLGVGENVKNLCPVNQKTYFYSVGANIIRVQNDQQTTFTTSSEILSLAWNNAEEALYFGTHASGLGCLKNGQIHYFTESSHGLPRNLVRHVVCDSEGGVWFNTSAHLLGGLGYLQNNRVVIFTPQNSLLPDNLIKSIVCRDQEIWVATGGYVTYQKVVKIAAGQWELLPIYGYYLMEMDVDTNGALNIIDDYGLSSSFSVTNHIINYTGKQTKILLPPGATRFSFYPYRLKSDRRNYLWVAKYSSPDAKQLIVYNGESWIEAPASFPDDFINCIATDPQNRIWLGTTNGIYRLDQ